MKPMMMVGILLLVLGVVALGYEGFTYTTKEKVIDLGPVQVTADKQKTIPLCWGARPSSWDSCCSSWAPGSRSDA